MATPDYNDGSIPIDEYLFIKTTLFQEPLVAKWDGQGWWANRARGEVPREVVLAWSLVREELE